MLILNQAISGSIRYANLTQLACRLTTLQCTSKWRVIRGPAIAFKTSSFFFAFFLHDPQDHLQLLPWRTSTSFLSQRAVTHVTEHPQARLLTKRKRTSFATTSSQFSSFPARLQLQSRDLSSRYERMLVIQIRKRLQCCQLPSAAGA